MPTNQTPLYSFNRGLVSPLALARTDIERVGLSAETCTNWMPRNLGSMMLRSGTKYIGATRNNNAAEFIPFVFSTSDIANIEITDLYMRVWVSDALVTRASVSTTISEPAFSAQGDWTDDDEVGGAGVVAGGVLALTGNGTAAAKWYQDVTIAAGDQNVEHALDINVTFGPATLRIGTAQGLDDLFSETYLGTGIHSIAVTPTGANMFIEFSSRNKYGAQITSCDIASSGVMEVVAPWAGADLEKIRYDQSGDIVYVACDGYRQYSIERRSTTSWSVVEYTPKDGPFRSINDGPITLASSQLTGGATLTASQPLFTSGNANSLYRLTSSGQIVTASVVAENNFTDAIRVTGVTTSRIFTVTRSGRVDSSITLQRSLTSDSGPWEDVATYTTNATVAYDDTLDNQIAWYRIGIKTGDYGTDTVVLTLDYPVGSVDGVFIATSFSTSTLLNGKIITAMGSTDATADWYEGSWSTRRGFPTSVAIAEGRLGWSGEDKTWLSASDAFETFTDLFAGDGEAIERTIGAGPVSKINWMVAVRKLLLGADGAEFSMRSSSDDEPLTPSNAHIKSFSTQGSATVRAAKLDSTAIFIQRGGSRVMEAAFGETYDYQTSDLTTFYPEAGDSPIVQIAIQRQPDTRIHCVRSDGDVSILLHDKAENVSCWVKYSSGGTVEDVVVLPGADGTGEDAVYYVIKRTVDGNTVRYLEKWSLESQCQGGTTSRQLDAHITVTSNGSATISGLTHLEGETVAVWGDGVNLGTYTVSGGSITASSSVTDGCIGLAYTAQWKSTKLTYAVAQGTALIQKKNLTTLGVIMKNTHYQGLEYGPDFTNMDNLPKMKDGVEIAANTVHTTFDEESFSFPGNWDTDSRLCLQATSPNPVTLLAAILGVEGHARY